MAIAYRAQSTGGRTSAGTLTLTKPTGTVDDDIMYAFFQSSSSASGTVATLSGWTLVDSDNTAGGWSYLFRKSASSEGSSYDWSISASGSFIIQGILLSFYDDAAGGAVEQDVYTKTVDATADTTANNTGITPTTSPGCMMVVFIGINGVATSLSSYAVANNNPSWTERYDTAETSGGELTTVAIATAVRDYATDTGAFTATIANSSPTAVYLLSIRPNPNLVLGMSVLTADSSLPSPQVNLSQTAALSVVSADADVEDPTSVNTTSDWTNQSKNSSVWVNQTKN